MIKVEGDIETDSYILPYRLYINDNIKGIHPMSYDKDNPDETMVEFCNSESIRLCEPYDTICSKIDTVMRDRNFISELTIKQ
jgi:hypothetical protein